MGPNSQYLAVLEQAGGGLSTQLSAFVHWLCSRVPDNNNSTCDTTTTTLNISSQHQDLSQTVAVHVHAHSRSATSHLATSEKTSPYEPIDNADKDNIAQYGRTPHSRALLRNPQYPDRTILVLHIDLSDVTQKWTVRSLVRYICASVSESFEIPQMSGKRSNSNEFQKETSACISAAGHAGQILRSLKAGVLNLDENAIGMQNSTKATVM